MVIFEYFLHGCNCNEIQDRLWEYSLDIGIKTLHNIYTALRAIITIYISSTNAETFLGKDNAVEVDESLFSHDHHSQKWGVCLIERNTQLARVFIVHDRTTSTMKQIFKENVVEGASVRSDFWRAYRKLKGTYELNQFNKAKLGYPSGDDTTSHIESLWGELKALRTNVYHGTTPGKTVHTFIDELLLRRELYIFKEENTPLERLIDVIVKHQQAELLNIANEKLLKQCINETSKIVDDSLLAETTSNISTVIESLYKEYEADFKEAKGEIKKENEVKKKILHAVTKSEKVIESVKVINEKFKTAKHTLVKCIKKKAITRKTKSKYFTRKTPS